MSELISSIEELSEIASDVFLINNWQATKADINLVEQIAASMKGNSDLQWILSHCVKIDSSTNRLITSGWNLFHGEFFFADGRDADAKARHCGYDSLEHAVNSSLEEDPDNPDVCHEVWWKSQD